MQKLIFRIGEKYEEIMKEIWEKCERLTY